MLKHRIDTEIIPLGSEALLSISQAVTDTHCPVIPGLSTALGTAAHQVLLVTLMEGSLGQGGAQNKDCLLPIPKEKRQEIVLHHTRIQ